MKKLKIIIKHNQQVINNIFGSFIVKGGSLIISVFLLPAYLRYFENQTVLGIWYTILSVLNWVLLFDLGLGQGLRNQLPIAIENDDTRTIRECISTTYVLMTVIAIIIALIGYNTIPFVDWNDILNVERNIVDCQTLTHCIRIVFCGIMLQIVLKIITSILYAIQKSAIVNMLGLTTNIVIYIMLFTVPSQDIKSNLLTMSWINVLAANLPYIVCTIVIFSSVLKNEKPSIKNFNRKYVKQIFNIGIALLWLQIVFMVISSTNEFLISNFTDPQNVVEYQAYYKIFKTVAMVVSLALVPMWSAVTKAKVQRNYIWIKKAYKFFLLVSMGCFVLEICIIPFLQFGFNIWLGEGVIAVNISYAITFVFSSTIFVLHNVNTTIGNGLSYFKIQMIWMTIAAVIFIPLSCILVKVTGSWIGVVMSNIISMVPYEIIAPMYTFRIIDNLERINLEKEMLDFTSQNGLK